MTPEQLQAACEAALAKWIPRLHLRDWRITLVMEKPSPPFEGATVLSVWNTREAIIHVDPDYLAVHKKNADAEAPGQPDADKIESMIVHELLHICEQPLLGEMQRNIKWAFGTSKEDGGAVSGDALDCWMRYRESLVNHLTRILIEADRSNGWSA